MINEHDTALIRRARGLARWEDISALADEAETMEGEYYLHRLARGRMHQEEEREERRREEVMEKYACYL